MASNNRFAGLPIDEQNSPREGPAVNKTRHQRARPNQETTQADKSAAPVQVAAIPDDTVASTNDDKPKEKGWEASLTLAQLKAYKTEEALKAHNKRFPPKAKQALATANKDTAQTKAVNTNKAHAGLKNLKTTNQGNSHWGNVARNGIDSYKAVPDVHQASWSGCGIKGCPVKDKHERRVYAMMDPNRPNLIKKIQAKFRPEGNEVRTLSQFFESHKQDWELPDRDGESQKHYGE